MSHVALIVVKVTTSPRLPEPAVNLLVVVELDAVVLGANPLLHKVFADLDWMDPIAVLAVLTLYTRLKYTTLLLNGGWGHLVTRGTSSGHIGVFCLI